MKKVEKISSTKVAIRDAEGSGYDVYLTADYSYHAAGWYAVIRWPLYPRGRRPAMPLEQTYHNTPEAAIETALPKVRRWYD